MTPDRDALTPAYAAELLHRQDALQAEARAVLADLGLMRLLAQVGTPAQIGSSALGLMVWRDLGVIVASPGLSAARALTVMQPALAHPRVAGARYANKSGAFNDTGKGQPRDPRYFFEIHYRTDTAREGVDWNVDVSLWLDAGPRHEIADLASIARQLTVETRLAILWIKDVWHRLPAYRGGAGTRAVGCRDVYDAVLRHGILTPGGFDGYLRQHGKPARGNDVPLRAE